MAELSLTIGAGTISVPIKGTAVQIRAAVKRYALQRGIATEGRTDADIGTDVLRALLKIVKDGSLDRHRIELLQAQQDAMNSTLETENDL